MRKYLTAIVLLVLLLLFILNNLAIFREPATAALEHVGVILDLTPA
ncbi:MAG: hypothetical protein R3A44_10645 [Caldilineaceae bacterium]